MKIVQNVIIALIVTCSMMNTTNATSNSPVAVNSSDVLKALPYEYIGSYVSNLNETEHQFLLRISPNLRDFSDKTGFEACGVIATDNKGKYGVVVGSSHSHIGCANYVNKIPDGMTSTNETIHSHGKHSLRIHTNASDIILMGSPVNYPEYIGGFDLSHFSDQDYENSGYLATPDGLIYQHGVGTTVKIMSNS